MYWQRISIISILGIVALLAAMWQLRAQQAGAPAPQPLYTPPNFQDVLKGKSPLRLLVIANQTMLAWKAPKPVRVIALADGKELYKSAADEVVGMVNVPEKNAASLRKNSVSFCSVTSPIRLESDVPINIWLPNCTNLLQFTGPLIVVRRADGAFSVSREVQLESYLAAVVPAEMPATFHQQALRAQAIIARTYTLTHLGAHSADGADLCDTVHCQVCGDPAKNAKETNTAVTATKGMVVMDGEKLARTYYHSCCGGATDDAALVWGPEYVYGYLKGVSDLTDKKDPDVYCKSAPNFRWTRAFTAAEVDALVAKNLTKVTGDADARIAKVTNMSVEERTPLGRVASLRVEGDGASVLVYGDQARWLFGTGSPGSDGLWSTFFDMQVKRDEQKRIVSYTIRGAGRGHGIGLCQWGANGRAQAGQACNDILQAYFPGTTIKTVK